MAITATTVSSQIALFMKFLLDFSYPLQEKLSSVEVTVIYLNRENILPPVVLQLTSPSPRGFIIHAECCFVLFFFLSLTSRGMF